MPVLLKQRELNDPIVSHFAVWLKKNGGEEQGGVHNFLGGGHMLRSIWFHINRHEIQTGLKILAHKYTQVF